MSNTKQSTTTTDAVVEQKLKYDDAVKIINQKNELEKMVKELLAKDNESEQQIVQLKQDLLRIRKIEVEKNNLCQKNNENKQKIKELEDQIAVLNEQKLENINAQEEAYEQIMNMQKDPNYLTASVMTKLCVNKLSNQDHSYVVKKIVDSHFDNVKEIQKLEIDEKRSQLGIEEFKKVAEIIDHGSKDTKELLANCYLRMTELKHSHEQRIKVIDYEISMARTLSIEKPVDYRFGESPRIKDISDKVDINVLAEELSMSVEDIKNNLKLANTHNSFRNDYGSIITRCPEEITYLNERIVLYINNRINNGLSWCPCDITF